MRFTRIALSTVATAGAAVALASLASADPASGDYTGTMLDGGGTYQEGDKAPFTLNACGSNCIHLTETGSGWELHRQGNKWVGADADGTESLDDSTLVLTLDPKPVDATKPPLHVVIQLTKNA